MAMIFLLHIEIEWKIKRLTESKILSALEART